MRKITVLNTTSGLEDHLNIEAMTTLHQSKNMNVKITKKIIYDI